MTEPGQERRHAEGFFHVRLELARRFRFAVGGSVLRRACDAYLAELQRLYAACGVDVRSGAGNLSPVRKVSVVMPVFNSGTALVPCLESVLSQTYRNIEVVCVDDGSTDGSADVLADFAARDVRVRVVAQPHADAGTARNVGYAEATMDLQKSPCAVGRTSPTVRRFRLPTRGTTPGRSWTNLWPRRMFMTAGLAGPGTSL